MALVETDWLEKNLNNVKIIDCSWHMPQTSRNGFDEYKKLNGFWLERIAKFYIKNLIFKHSNHVLLLLHNRISDKIPLNKIVPLGNLI